MTLALICLGGALIVIGFSRGSALVAPLWPINALALVMLLRQSRGRADTLAFLGALLTSTALANWLGGSPLRVALAFSVLNSLEVWLSASLASHFALLKFRTTAQGWRFFLVAGPPGALLGGAGAALIAVACGQPHAAAAGTTWFCADLLGFVLVGPLGMTLSPRLIASLRLRQRWREAVATMLLVASVTAATFLQSSLPLLFMVGPFIVLATFRFGLIGANVAVLIAALVAIPLTCMGLGPLALVTWGGAHLKLLVLQLFLGLNGFTAVPLAGALTERDYLLRTSREREHELASRNAALERARRVAEIAEEVAAAGHFSLHHPCGDHHWSAGTFDLFGFPRSAEPPAFEDVIACYRPEARDEVRQAFDDAMSAGLGFSWEREILRPDGTLRWVRLKADAFQDGEGVRVLGVVRDVTAERLAADTLAKSERSFRLLAENATNVIARFGMDGRFTYLSPSIFSVLGYRPDELLGRSTAVVMHPQDYARSIEVYRAHLADGAPERGFSFEYRAFRKDGRMVWLSGRPRGVRDPITGELNGFQDVVRDVTDRVELMEALARARDEAEAAARAKSEFLANMSHELRTPLTSILGFADLLQPYLKDDPATRYLSRIVEGGSTLLATVNDILDFSKLEAGQIEIKPTATAPLQLCRSLCELLEPQAAAKQLDLRCVDVGLGSAWLWLDEVRTRQVLTNLLGNALKFTETGWVRLLVRRRGARLRFEVSDTGPGIPADRLDRLFQRFSQVDGSSTRLHGGTGLGLAISKGLVEAMGGEIGVESRLGGGSTFWFELPASEVSPLAVAAPSSEAAPADLQDLRLLVVDDNAMNRELVRVLAGGAGAEVAEAENGETAVALASVQPFDLILMDVSMPGIGGSEAVRRIRGRSGPNEAIPILAFTAFTQEAAPHDLDFSLFDGVVTKPVKAGALYRTISAAIGPVEQPAPELRLAHA